MLPMRRGQIVEREQDVAILHQALGCLRVFVGEGANELIAATRASVRVSAIQISCNAFFILGCTLLGA
jgi:hypothetical protein